MSRYENPFDGSPEDAARYVRALIELLGSDEPLDVLAEGPALVEAVLGETTPERRRFRERMGVWCIDEVLHHLADAEIVYANRYRRILSEEDPPVPGFDQDRWARVLRYETRDPALAVRLFGQARATNLELLRSLDASEWTRTGRHERRGREALSRVVELAAAHDRVHLLQIARIQRAASD